LKRAYPNDERLRRGVRRLDAALSKDPLKNNDVAENHSGSRTKSAKEILAAKNAKNA
jgi:hypothetical protein